MHNELKVCTICKITKKHTCCAQLSQTQNLQRAMIVNLPYTNPFLESSVNITSLLQILSIEQLKELADEIKKEIRRKEKSKRLAL